jgi:hypothetical protein
MEHGWQRGIGIVVESVVAAVFLGALTPLMVDLGYFPRGLVTLIFMAGIASAILTVKASKFWSWGYLAGVTLGILVALRIFLETEFLGAVDIILCGGTAVGAVLLRVHIHTSEF